MRFHEILQLPLEAGQKNQKNCFITCTFRKLRNMPMGGGLSGGGRGSVNFIFL